MGVKVSVVVPVYNAGEYIQPCIESLLGQSLPAGEYEVIFVDDGSTDDSLATLSAVAEQHEHVRVIPMENSGWPGKPRNVGTAAATGEYVQYVDQDDYIGPEALERMYAMGSKAKADVVVGKMVGVGRWTPTALFKRNRTDATLFDTDLVASLTPHKMFRRQFLLDHQIAFPEGKRRLEDFVFVMECYVAASAVCIVADYPCYYYTKRTDGKNTSFQRIDPDSYFDNLAEVVAVVDQHVPAGPRRDALLERFYRSEVLRRLSEPNILRTPGDFLDQLVDGSRRAADALFSESTRQALAPVVRARAELLREGRTDGLIELAQRASDLKARAVATRAAWSGSTLATDVTASLQLSGQPWAVVEEGGSFVVDHVFTQALGPADPIVLGSSAEDVLKGARIDVVVRDRATSIDWPVEHTLEPRLVKVKGASDKRHQLEFSGRLTFEPLSMAGGEALARGSWDVSVRITAWGLTRTARVAVGPRVRVRELPRRLGDRRLPVVPYATDKGNLTLDVGQKLKKWTPPVASGTKATLRATLRRRTPASVKGLYQRLRSTRG